MVSARISCFDPYTVLPVYNYVKQKTRIELTKKCMQLQIKNSAHQKIACASISLRNLPHYVCLIMYEVVLLFFFVSSLLFYRIGFSVIAQKKNS